ncbi:MAG: aspartate--tRNA ligase [bacterium]
MHPYRTHTCNELRREHVDQRVRLSGWINNKRDHGGVLFIDLRDHYGMTQVVIFPDASFQNKIAHFHKETVIMFEGTVTYRSEDTFNPKIATGEVEVVAEKYELLGRCNWLPFSIFPEEEAPEETRLKYRCVDLRRPRLHRNITLRSEITASIRCRMMEMGFYEYQTPILTSSSPEGARDYLVPSRVHPGCFYALPQAPQQFKQLMMVAGFDKYFQIAPCFRDEDSRANRSPGEFYQIDMEMSFVTQEDIFRSVEALLSGIFKEFTDWEVDQTPFRRIPYKEALLAYGTDKPDLRNPLIIRDVTDIFADSSFRAFKGVIDDGGVVRAIAVKNIASRPRSFFDSLVSYSQSIGSQGLAYLVWSQEAVKGPIAKVMSAKRLNEIKERCGVSADDVVFFICNEEDEANRIAGCMRTELGVRLDLLEERSYRFCWIIDYPMYEWDKENKCVIFSHNPFSMPQGGLQAMEEQPPLEILAYQYDIVCNGEELSSGAIRNHKPEIMYKVFEIAGYTKQEVEEKFPSLINAFKLGCPPHGGIAPGLDRIIMLITHEANIREVIAFPMNQKAQDLMMNAPREVLPEQLEELHIRVVPPFKKKESHHE